MAEALAYLAVAAIGITAAAAELLSRYRDSPWAATFSRAGLAYLFFNAAISVVTLYLIREIYPIHEAVDGRPTTRLPELATEVLVAGAASMAVLRSSFFTTRVGDKDVEIGLAGLVQVFRDTIDRDVDRVRAGPRAENVWQIMNDVSFVRAYGPLTSISMNLLQNIGAEERARIVQQVNALANETGRSDEDKALELGLILAGAVGFPVLKAAKEKLGAKIARGTDRSELVADAVAALGPEVFIRELPMTCLSLATNVPTDEQTALGEQIDLIARTDVSAAVKAVNVGLILADVVGEESFAAAVELLRGLNTPKEAEPG